MKQYTLSHLFWVIASHTLPSKLYLSIRYRVVFGKWISWQQPVAFTEKLQWLKLYSFDTKYTSIVDKVEVKKYVDQVLGEGYTTRTYATWDKVGDVDFDVLPNRFVLKCNHDSGTIIVCEDKKKLDIKQTRLMLKKALSTNYYWRGREKPYKDVSRKILAEEYIEHEGDLVDYKFFCFGGTPKMVKIDYDRSTKHHANYYDIEMNLLPFFKKSSQPEFTKEFHAPENYSKMVEIARILSTDIPFVRVDLYNVDGRIFFGEMTFFPSSGFEPLTDDYWDVKIGSWLHLPEKRLC